MSACVGIQILKKYLKEFTSSTLGSVVIVFLYLDALTSLYLRLYCVEHIVKDHSDSERAILSDQQQGLFYMHYPRLWATDRIDKHIVKPVVEHWLEREIAQWVHHEGSIR